MGDIPEALNHPGNGFLELHPAETLQGLLERGDGLLVLRGREVEGAEVKGLQSPADHVIVLAPPGQADDLVAVLEEDLFLPERIRSESNP